MKGRKEYLVLIAIILVLVTYLYFKRTDQLHYAIPQLSAVDSKNLTRIELTAKGETVAVSKKGGVWCIEPKGYPADPSKVEKMLGIIGSLTLTDMVSDTENFARYELGDKDKITVKAYAGTEVSRRFDVGKAAPTSRHTFVRLPESRKVYQARDSFRDVFLLNAAGLRDRKVLSFGQDVIRKMSIAKGSRVITLTRSGSKPDEAGWIDARGREVPKPDADAILSSLYDLECAGYPDGLTKAGLGAPDLTVTLSGTKDYTLSLYAKQGDTFPATSSGSAYVFTLADYQLDNIRKSAEKLFKKP